MTERDLTFGFQILHAMVLVSKRIFPTLESGDIEGKKSDGKGFKKKSGERRKRRAKGKYFT